MGSREIFLCNLVQYYDRTAQLVGEIRDVLETDLTSEDNLEKLENFKRDANAYGEDMTVSMLLTLLCDM